MRILKMSIAVIAIIIAISAVVLVIANTSDSPAVDPCTVEACIKVTTADNAVYLINDFRFDGKDCIYLTTISDNVKHHYCGKYKMEWIGPDNMKATKV